MGKITLDKIVSNLVLNHFHGIQPSDESNLISESQAWPSECDGLLFGGDKTTNQGRKFWSTKVFQVWYSNPDILWCSHILCVKSSIWRTFSLNKGTRFPGAELLFPLICVLLLWQDLPAKLELELPMFQSANPWNPLLHKNVGGWMDVNLPKIYQNIR